jgi:hypothetical protein
MREHEQRELLVIEENLVAEAPELAELFDALDMTRQSSRLTRALRWLAVALLFLDLALGEGLLLLGALVLTGIGVNRWTVRSFETDEIVMRSP